MNVDYVPIPEVAKTVGCSDTTIWNYVRMSEESETHLPFPDTIVLYDGNMGRPTRAIRVEDVIVFANWYKKNGGKRGSYKAFKDSIKNVEEEKCDNTAPLKLELEELKKKVIDIGTQMIGLINEIDKIEKRL